MNRKICTSLPRITSWYCIWWRMRAPCSLCHVCTFRVCRPPTKITNTFTTTARPRNLRPLVMSTTTYRIPKPARTTKDRPPPPVTLTAVTQPTFVLWKERLDVGRISSSVPWGTPTPWRWAFGILRFYGNDLGLILFRHRPIHHGRL